ncbi:unnamed protein product [Closterium sp. Naga37s-1]|nr:unnamed protein product [Closterium sp. Naga37s-1]
MQSKQHGLGTPSADAYIPAESAPAEEPEEVRVLRAEVQLLKGGLARAREREAAALHQLQEVAAAANAKLAVANAEVASVRAELSAANARANAARREKDAAMMAADRRIDALQRELSVLMEEREEAAEVAVAGRESLDRAEEYLKALDIAKVEVKKLRLERDILMEKNRLLEEEKNKSKNGKKSVDNAQAKGVSDVPDVHVTDPVGGEKSPASSASDTVLGPFEALLDLPIGAEQAAGSSQKESDGKEESAAHLQDPDAEGGSKDEDAAGDIDNNGDDLQQSESPGDEDDGYLSDDSDEHLEPDSLNSVIALKRFSLTLLVPILRSVEVKRAAVTVAAMLDEWKELLSSEMLQTTTYQDLTAVYFSGARYGRLQVTFNNVRDANFFWNQVIRHECVNGDFIDLAWQHPEDARFLRERVLNPMAKEIVVKNVPADLTAELIRRLLVVSKLVKRGRSAFVSGFGFHRTVDPVTGLDTDRIRGLIIPHAGDEYRWRYFVEDPTTGKRYLLHYPSLTCDLCGGQHLSRYHDRYVTPRQENFSNWNLSVKKTDLYLSLLAAASLIASDLLKRIMRDPAVILSSTGGAREEWICVQAACEKAQGNRFEQASAHIASARHKGGLKKEGSATRVSVSSQKMIAFKREYVAKPAK